MGTGWSKTTMRSFSIRRIWGSLKQRHCLILTMTHFVSLKHFFQTADSTCTVQTWLLPFSSITEALDSGIISAWSLSKWPRVVSESDTTNLCEVLERSKLVLMLVRSWIIVADLLYMMLDHQVMIYGLEFEKKILCSLSILPNHAHFPWIHLKNSRAWSQHLKKMIGWKKNHDYITMMVRLPFQVQMYAMFNLPFFSICYSFTKNFVWIFELFVLSTLMAYISY